MFIKTIAVLFGISLLMMGIASAEIQVATWDNPGYWTSESGRVWTDSFGYCWKTVVWTPETAIVECECEGVVPIDSDQDGVPDDLDTCPRTPLDASVDADGCELDSDRDGVVDRLDLCADTPAGSKVDASGCVKIESDGDGVVDSLDKCPGTAVEIAGYTDNRGSASLNKALSLKRATSVASYLVTKSVAAANLKPKGNGADSPIADNETSAGRAKNRRVELHILSR